MDVKLFAPCEACAGCCGVGSSGADGGCGASIGIGPVLNGKAAGWISGIRINAITMEPLKVNAAIIHSRLRVRILPADSKTESSNMACLPEKVQPRRPGSRVLFKSAGGRAALRAPSRAESGVQGPLPPQRRRPVVGGPGTSLIPIGTTVLSVDTAYARTVPGKYCDSTIHDKATDVILSERGPRRSSAWGW